MFEEKTLVALGCSHTYGQYMGDYIQETCHERSWVKKLEHIGNFKDSINLGLPGGSNYRSERVLFDFLKENNTTDLVVIFTITELSRFETFDSSLKEPVFESQRDIGYQSEASWKLLPDLEFPVDPKKVEYLKYHYTHCSDNKEDVRIINRKIVLIHSLLKLLNIEHYFLEMIANPETIERTQLNLKLPFIEFEDHGNLINAIEWVKQRYSLGSCGHWAEEANQCLAEYMFNYIKDNRYE